MGVSKQDWKDYESNEWLGATRKSSYDELMGAFDTLYKAIDNDDTAEFLAYTMDSGKLMAAAIKASNAAGDALEAIRKLRLDGNQRRFANKNAIATSDAGINSVDQYNFAISILCEGLVRGVRIEYETVAEDHAKMPSIKTGNLKDRLEGERSRIEACANEANTKVAAMGAIDKIGVV